MKINRTSAGLMVVGFLSAGSFAQQMVTNVVFSDNFNGDDNTNSVNGNLAIRQSGALATKYYAKATGALEGYQILDGKLYHQSGHTSAQFFLSTIPAIADANSRVDMYSNLAGRKYSIEASLRVAASSAAIGEFVRLYFSDQATTAGVEFQIEQIRGGGNVRLNVEGIQTHAANTAGDAENIVKLVVDETGAQTTYEFFVNGVSVDSGTMTFESNERHLWFHTSGGATATMDDLTVNVIEEQVAPFDEWISQYDVGVATNRTDNPDGDRLNNLYEWALGGNPTDGTDIGLVPTSRLVDADGTNYLEYVYAKRVDADELGLVYELVLTDDLVFGSWTNDGSYIEIPGGSITNGFVAVTNRVPTATKNVQFAGLNVDNLAE